MNEELKRDIERELEMISGNLRYAEILIPKFKEQIKENNLDIKLIFEFCRVANELKNAYFYLEGIKETKKFLKT